MKTAPLCIWCMEQLGTEPISILEKINIKYLQNFRSGGILLPVVITAGNKTDIRQENSSIHKKLHQANRYRRQHGQQENNNQRNDH